MKYKYYIPREATEYPLLSPVIEGKVYELMDAVKCKRCGHIHSPVHNALSICYCGSSLSESGKHIRGKIKVSG